MNTPTSAEKSLVGKIGAFSLHAQGKTNTGPAREALHRRFEREVDPNNRLTVTERARRVAAAKSAHYSRIALKSAQSRRRKAGVS